MMPGTRLGRYEILSQIGAGGRGGLPDPRPHQFFHRQGLAGGTLANIVYRDDFIGVAICQMLPHGSSTIPRRSP